MVNSIYLASASPRRHELIEQLAGYLKLFFLRYLKYGVKERRLVNMLFA